MKKSILIRLLCLLIIGFYQGYLLTPVFGAEMPTYGLTTPKPETPPDRGLDARQRDAVKDLIKTLEDKSSRQQMVKDLQTLLLADSKLSPKQTSSPWGLKTISETLHSITSKIFEFFEELHLAMDRVRNYFEDENLSPLIIETLYKILGILVLGIILDSGLRKIQRACRPAFLMNARHHHFRHKRLLFNVIVINLLISMVLFFILSFGLYFLQSQGVMNDILKTTLMTTLLYIIFLNIIRSFFHWKDKLVTLFSLSKSTRSLIYRFLRFILATSALGIELGHIITDLEGPAIFYTALTKGVLLSQCISTITFILRVKIHVGNWLISGTKGENSENEVNKLYGRAVQTWHLWAISYILVFGLTIYFQTINDIREVIISFLATAFLVTIAYLLVLKMPTLTYNMIGKIVGSFPHMASRHRFYGVFVSFIFGIFIIIAFLYGAFKIWDIESIEFLFSDGVKPIFATFFNICFIFIIGVILWEVNEYLIQQIFNQETKTYKDRVRRQRLATMMPLIQITARGFILGIFMIMTFSELKLDVTPLLASLGVIGIAFSFGSQSLVKDFITGIFILIEDTMNVGDIVQIDSQKGTVETLSLRTVKLRDTAGDLHTIPFSAINRVTNMTKNFAYYVIEIIFPFDQDLEPALTAIRDIDEEIRNDSKFRNYILSPVEIMGLDRFVDRGAAVLARIKTVPDRHRWVVGREFNLRLKRLFNERNISFSDTTPPRVST